MRSMISQPSLLMLATSSCRRLVLASLFSTGLCIGSSSATIHAHFVSDVHEAGVLVFTGRLVNEKGEYLGGCTITEKGTTNAVQSKADGTFSIEVAGPASVLQISYVGYESRDIVVGNMTGYTITLTPSSSSLDQVVVVGYASQKKATVTGAISTVKGSDLVKAPVPNLTAAVVGRVPGLLSVQRSGQPGNDETTLRIRGIGTLDNGNAGPLVLVDGVE